MQTVQHLLGTLIRRACETHPHRRRTALGGVGNTGTVAAASGNPHRSLHLHWEIHVNGRHLAEGLSRSDTRAVYAALFRLDNP